MGLEGVDTILSFGLLGPGKGYERVIEAMPAIVAAHPKAQYVILGATHPDVLAEQGQAYRTSLVALAAKLRVSAHVRLVDEFVGRNVLTKWLQAAMVFVTPTPDLDTMLSGPLAYAMATGRAIVSTPYAYATELLADGRGLPSTRRPRRWPTDITQLLADPARRAAMGERAHDHARPMAWGRVGAAYPDLFGRVTAEPAPAPPPSDSRSRSSRADRQRIATFAAARTIRRRRAPRPPTPRNCRSLPVGNVGRETPHEIAGFLLGERSQAAKCRLVGRASLHFIPSHAHAEMNSPAELSARAGQSFLVLPGIIVESEPLRPPGVTRAGARK